jgi:hypothetical protein
VLVMCNDTNALPIVNTAKSVAIATLIFAIFSCTGFAGPYWFASIGGILAVVGTSIILCCATEVPAGHLACSVLCAVSAILHAIGVCLDVYWVATILTITQDSHDTDSVHNQSAVTGVYIWLIWPICLFGIVSCILETTQVVVCVHARTALLAQTRPPPVVRVDAAHVQTRASRQSPLVSFSVRTGN